MSVFGFSYGEFGCWSVVAEAKFLKRVQVLVAEAKFLKRSCWSEVAEAGILVAVAQFLSRSCWAVVAETWLLSRGCWAGFDRCIPTTSRNLGIGHSVIQWWDVALSILIPATNHNSAIIAEKHRMISTSRNLGIRPSVIRRWNVTLSIPILAASHNGAILRGRRCKQTTGSNHQGGRQSIGEPQNQTVRIQPNVKLTLLVSEPANEPPVRAMCLLPNFTHSTGLKRKEPMEGG